MKVLTCPSDNGNGYSVAAEDLPKAITKLGMIEYKSYYLISEICDERCKYQEIFAGMENGEEKLLAKCEGCPLDKLANMILGGKDELV